MHVFVPPAPRPIVAAIGAACRLVDGLAWLATDDEVVVVATDEGDQLLAVVACGSASERVLAGDARPVVLPAVALGASAVTVVALGRGGERCLDRARSSITESAELAELRLVGVVAHERPGSPLTAADQTSSRRASP